MRLLIASFGIALVAVVSAQDATTTVLAACGTSCPTGPAPDVIVTRSNEPVPESTPCPSLVASGSGATGGMMNGSIPTATGLVPSAPIFTGAAAHATAGVGAAAGLIVALLAL